MSTPIHDPVVEPSLRLRTTLNGRTARTLQDTTRNPHDYWLAHEPDLLDVPRERDDPRVYVAAALVLALSVGVPAVWHLVHRLPALLAWLP